MTPLGAPANFTCLHFIFPSVLSSNNRVLPIPESRAAKDIFAQIGKTPVTSSAIRARATRSELFDVLACDILDDCASAPHETDDNLGPSQSPILQFPPDVRNRPREDVSNRDD